MSWVAANTRKKTSQSSPSTGYTRPADWLTMPTLTDADQQISLLIAVANDSTGLNKIAFTIAGNYTVDWGDGSSSENFNTGVKAEHEYSWGDISESTLTSDGYRQCICTVTPQSGQNLTAFDLRVWPTTYPIMWRQPIMFFVAAGANITSIGFGGFDVKNYAPLTILKEINIVKLGAITNFSYAWYGCSSLQSLNVDTSSGTNFSNAWYGCSSLQSVIITNQPLSFTVSDCKLSTQALEELFTSLKSGVTSQTVTCSGCFGYAGISTIQREIATNKGWTIA